MQFTAQHYIDASQEHVNLARRLHAGRDYVAAVYFGGLAVEALLRGYRFGIDPEFDARHDLSALVKASGIMEFVPAKRRRNIAASMGDLWARWKNNYRFASESRLRSEFASLAANRRIKGDVLKESSRIVVEAALEIVAIGVVKWHSKTS